MPVNGYYEMSSTMHNGHSTWESTSNEMVLFKGTSGAWYFDRTIKRNTGNYDSDDCPGKTELALHTFPVRIASQGGLFMSFRQL